MREAKPGDAPHIHPSGLQNLPIFFKGQNEERAAHDAQREGRERADLDGERVGEEGVVGKIARSSWTVGCNSLGTMSHGRALVVGTRLASRTRLPVERIARTVSGGSEYGSVAEEQIDERENARVCFTTIEKLFDHPLPVSRGFVEQCTRRRCEVPTAP